MQRSSQCRPLNFGTWFCAMINSRSSFISVRCCLRSSAYIGPAINNLLYLSRLPGYRAPDSRLAHGGVPLQASIEPVDLPTFVIMKNDLGRRRSERGRHRRVRLSVGSDFHRNSAFNSHPVVDMDSSDNPSSIYPSESSTLPAEFRGRHLSASLDILTSYSEVKGLQITNFIFIQKTT